MLLHKIILSSTRSSAAKNAIKNGDILLSINNKELPTEGNLEQAKSFIQTVLENALSSPLMKLLIKREEKNIEFTIKTKNHGVEVESIDLVEVAKEEQRKAAIEQEKQEEIQRAVELQLAIEKHKENYKFENKNKTIIVRSPFLQHFFVCQFSPEEPDKKSIKEQIKEITKNEKLLLLIDYSDTLFEVVFETLDDEKAKFGIQLANNKMLSSGYLYIKGDVSIVDNNKDLHFSHETPEISQIFYFLAFLSIFSAFFLYIKSKDGFGFLFVILGILSAISYIWFGKVLSYLEGLKQILLKR
jgi:hypothetical protein